jgi:hypothetical protein
VTHHIYTVLPHERQRILGLRGLIGRQMNVQYAGWSDEFDAQFDSQALWFSLEEGQDVKAVTRLMFPRADRALPMQLAHFNPFEARSEESFCEGSGLYFRELADIQTLFYSMACWMCEHRVAKCYVTYDAMNRVMRQLYSKYFGFEAIPGHEGMTFDGFVQRATWSTVVWKPLVLRSIPAKIARFQAIHSNIARLEIPSVDLEGVYGWPRNMAWQPSGGKTDMMDA